MSRLCILALLVVAAIGSQVGCCCVYSPERLETIVTGKPVPEETLRRVQAGKTTRWWLLRSLGHPCRVERQPDGAELLTYEYARTTEERLSILGAELHRDETVERARLFFELRDGVVQRVWRDSA